MNTTKIRCSRRRISSSVLLLGPALLCAGLGNLLLSGPIGAVLGGADTSGTLFLVRAEPQPQRANQQQHHHHPFALPSPLLTELRGGGGGKRAPAPQTRQPNPSPKNKKASPGSASDSHHHHHAGELMSSTTAVANVLADLCPHGMLPIAFGMAAAGGTGPVLATATLLVFGLLSWYSLVSFARAADAVLVRGAGPAGSSGGNEEEAGESLSAVWSRILPRGEATAYIPDLGCVFLTVGCLLFYSSFIGDLFGSLVSGINGLPDILRKRWSVLLLLHVVPILPLCLKKDLSALKYSSMTGLAGIIYTIFFVGKRLVDGSYAAGGKFFSLMPARFQPAAQAGFPHRKGGVLGYVGDLPPFHAGKGLLILMNMCCVAYACHYNAVKYFMELEDRTVSNLKSVMMYGIGGTALVFWCMMVLGYATFGSNSQALILNNYHGSQDLMATVARAFTGVAIISGYALMFAGLKAALFSITKLDRPDAPRREAKQRALSVLLLAGIAVAACFVTEHELATVIGIVGSVFGSVVIYMFPAFVNNSLLKIKDKKGNAIAEPFFRGEEIFNNVMVAFGVIFAILGTWISIATAEH